MSVYSAARWVSSDASTGFIKVGGDNIGSLTIEHYYESNGLKSFTRALTPLGNDIYSYSLPSTVQEGEVETSVIVLDRWKLYENGSLVVSFVSDAVDFFHDFFEEPAEFTVPSNTAEQRIIENKVYRLWAHYPWTPFQRKISVANAVPSGLNGAIYTYTVANTNLFEGCFLPQQATRESINGMLSSAPDLFKGNTGRVFYIQAENKIVVPLSDNSRTWTEEFPMSSFLTAAISWVVNNADTSMFTPTVYNVITKTGVITFNTGSSNTRSYRPEDVPTQFSSGIQAIESSYAQQNIDVDKYTIGDGRKKGFMVDGVGGVIYGSDNFISQ